MESFIRKSLSFPTGAEDMEGAVYGLLWRPTGKVTMRVSEKSW